MKRKIINIISFSFAVIFMLLNLLFNSYLFFMFGWICAIITIITHDWVYPVIKNITKNQGMVIPKELKLDEQ